MSRVVRTSLHQALRGGRAWKKALSRQNHHGKEGDEQQNFASGQRNMREQVFHEPKFRGERLTCDNREQGWNENNRFPDLFILPPGTSRPILRFKLRLKRRAMTTIYHNPRCSKSRETLALLRAEGITPEVVLYVETPVSRAKLAELVARSGLSAAAFLRANEAEAKEMGVSATSDPEAILDAIAAHPRLMERPIVETAKGVALGRPPEAVKAVL